MYSAQLASQLELSGGSRPSGHLYSLPVELLDAIFALACTDDGHTGCALSCVSKSIRSASRAFRFHTVALCASHTHQVTQFLSSFTAQRAQAEASGSARPRVRHLFLAAAQRRRKRETTWRARPPTSNRGGDRKGQKYKKDVQSLLELVSPHLQTFFILRVLQDCDIEFELPDLGTLSLPVLQELHVFGDWRDLASCETYGSNA